jgi:hypothetical protein
MNAPPTISRDILQHHGTETCRVSCNIYVKCQTISERADITFAWRLCQHSRSEWEGWQTDKHRCNRTQFTLFRHKLWYIVRRQYCVCCAGKPLPKLFFMHIYCNDQRVSSAFKCRFRKLLISQSPDTYFNYSPIITDFTNVAYSLFTFLYLTTVKFKLSLCLRTRRWICTSRPTYLRLDGTPVSQEKTKQP